MLPRCLWWRVGTVVIIMFVAGCIDLTGRPSDPAQTAITADSSVQFQFQGHVFLMRGFLGIFSLGIDTMADYLNAHHIVRAAALDYYRRPQFVNTLVADSDRGILKGPLILCGHSWGADEQIRAARALGAHGVKVQLLLLIDPITPPLIPPNVERCVDIYKSWGWTGWPLCWGASVQVQNADRTQLTDTDLRYARVGFATGNLVHQTIVNCPGVQKLMRHYIRTACRSWQKRHPTAKRGRT